MEIKLTVDIPTELTLNMTDIAIKLAEKNSAEQAELFNAFFEELKKRLSSHNFDMQLAYIVDDLNDLSRNSVEGIFRFIELSEQKEQANGK